MINLIIGKNSNLSKRLSQKLDKHILISARDILNNKELLNKYKNDTLNIIFNNFQPSTSLHHTSSYQEYITNAILTTSIVLDTFNKTQINKIIYTSSSSVYGNNILCNENDELKPLNLHASLKVSNEKLIEEYCKKNNIDYTITRIFNMYGGDDKFSIISKIINACKNSTTIQLVNEGNAIRDFIHIDDVVSVYIQLLEINNIPLLNVGTGVGNSLKNIINYICSQGITIDIKNIYKDELNTSTADINILNTINTHKTFWNIKNYLKKELNL